MSDPADCPAHVTFWGTRGSISTPGRATEKYGGNTPCVSIVHGETRIIVDAGTGLRNLGLELCDELPPGRRLDLHLLLSHTHWDHIQGLPFFQPAYTPGVSLAIYGNARRRGFLENILQGQMDEDYFPVSMSALGAKLSVHELSAAAFRLGDIEVDWQEQVYHPGGCVRYRFRIGDRTIVYASDVELNKVVAPAEPTPEKEARLNEYLDFVRGADLLIGDGQYTPEEYQTKANFGHTTIPVIIDLAIRAQVRQLAIFHHEPQHSDSMLDEYLIELHDQFDHCRGDLNFFWAREGVTLPI